MTTTTDPFKTFLLDKRRANPEEQAAADTFINRMLDLLRQRGVPEDPMILLCLDDVLACYLLARRADHHLETFLSGGVPLCAKDPEAFLMQLAAKSRDRLRRAMAEFNKACAKAAPPKPRNTANRPKSAPGQLPDPQDPALYPADLPAKPQNPADSPAPLPLQPQDPAPVPVQPQNPAPFPVQPQNPAPFPVQPQDQPPQTPPSPSPTSPQTQPAFPKNSPPNTSNHISNHPFLNPIPRTTPPLAAHQHATNKKK